MIFAIFNPWKLTNENFSFPEHLDLLPLFFATLQDHLWLSFWRKSIAFDDFQKNMILSIFNPWKLANNIFSFPYYLDLLHLFFNSLRDHL